MESNLSPPHELNFYKVINEQNKQMPISKWLQNDWNGHPTMIEYIFTLNMSKKDGLELFSMVSPAGSLMQI